jgi:hypothetical protein
LDRSIGVRYRSAGFLSEARPRSNPLGAKGVEAALPITGRVVERVVDASLVCPLDLIACFDGKFALLYQSPNFPTFAGVLAPLVGMSVRRGVAIAATADKAR